MQLNPYLAFDGKCREAFEVYAHVLGGDITFMMPYRDSPMADKTPPEWLDRIMHARLVSGHAVLMGSDSPPQFHEKAAGFHVSLMLDDPHAAERIFAALAEGGEIGMPIQQTFWAERFGMLKDRFGTPWMINCEGKAAAS